jgi:hypothetical protein
MPAVALLDLRGDLVRLATTANCIEKLVVDPPAHLVPLTDLGEAVQLGLQFAAADRLEHGAVRGRRAVERDLLADRAAARGAARRVAAGRRRTRAGDREVLAAPVPRASPRSSAGSVTSRT